MSIEHMPGNAIIKKEFEVRVKIKCWVEPLSKEAAADDLKNIQNVDKLYSNQGVWLQIERQQRLFDLLLSNKHIIDQMLKAEAVDFLNQSDDLLGESDLDITEVLRSLSLQMEKQSDIDHFTDSENNGLFAESVEHIYHRFKTELESIEMTEVDA